ncbi:MAG: hypothetical protein KGJ07_04075, partial [Patescibacteria group bacterium]|nr:hypothetical protein [Patescibacteria group bacterium]
ILKEKKSTWFFLSFPVAALLYICIFATGNVQHDYYQIVIMPSVAILCGFGATFLVSFLQKYMRRYIAYAIVGVLIFVGFWLGWIQVKDYFNINNPSIVVAGQAVNRLTPKDAIVIAPYNGDSSFLYQTNRQGWASFDYDLPKLISLGAEYLVLVNPTQQDLSFGKTYKAVSNTKQYVLYDLRQKP